MRVQVYANLTRKLWSLKNKEKGSSGYGKLWKHCKYARHIRLTDVKFTVNQTGRERVRREKKKYVHAFAEGTASKDWLTETAIRRTWQDRDLVMDHVMNFKRVTYNPYSDIPSFYIEDTMEPIHESSEVFMIYPEGQYPVVLARVSNKRVN